MDSAERVDSSDHAEEIEKSPAACRTDRKCSFREFRGKNVLRRLPCLPDLPQYSLRYTLPDSVSAFDSGRLIIEPAISRNWPIEIGP